MHLYVILCNVGCDASNMFAVVLGLCIAIVNSIHDVIILCLSCKLIIVYFSVALNDVFLS